MRRLQVLAFATILGLGMAGKAPAQGRGAFPTFYEDPQVMYYTPPAWDFYTPSREPFYTPPNWDFYTPPREPFYAPPTRPFYEPPAGPYYTPVRYDYGHGPWSHVPW